MAITLSTHDLFNDEHLFDSKLLVLEDGIEIRKQISASRFRQGKLEQENYDHIKNTVSISADRILSGNNSWYQFLDYINNCLELGDIEMSANSRYAYISTEFYIDDSWISILIQYLVYCYASLRFYRDFSIGKPLLRDNQEKYFRLIIKNQVISDFKLFPEELSDDIFHDDLTGLFNRKFLLSKLNNINSNLGKSSVSYQFSLLILDVDRFKLVNNVFGYHIGDQLLLEIGQRLKKNLRETDILARIGNDEFAILLQDVKKVTQASQIAERIKDLFAVPFLINEYEIFINVSIGISSLGTNLGSPELVLHEANTAMSYSRLYEGSDICIFKTEMYSYLCNRWAIEQDLHKAIDNNEFYLQYQPIVAITSQEITGFEALIRWEHPEYGLISPDKFIPVAEETGLIIPIGKWVLQEACHQMKRWKEEFDFAAEWTLSVNLSVKQLEWGNLTRYVQEVLGQSRLGAESLKLEITESCFLENTERTKNILKSLQEIGIKLVIDDFGTGYSSLSYLLDFHFDVLKLDCSFIKGLDDKKESMTIIRAILTLAESLGMEVVAEGLESDRQFAQLSALNCKYGQGYFFSRPLSVESVYNYVHFTMDKPLMSQENFLTIPLDCENEHFKLQDSLLFEIESLRLQVSKLKREKADLEILLETTAGHAEMVELEFQQELIDHEQAEQNLLKSNYELQNLSYIDPLTQIANRRKFHEYLDYQWKISVQNNLSLSLILADVDYFKRYNDEYGHQAGDYCLVRVAQAINRAVGQDAGLVARYGGEEFVAVLPKSSASKAVAVAETIRREIRQLNIPHSQSFISKNITLSMGIVSTIPDKADYAESLIGVADKALYSAKEHGRNRFDMICH